MVAGTGLVRESTARGLGNDSKISDQLGERPLAVFVVGAQNRRWMKHRHCRGANTTSMSSPYSWSPESRADDDFAAVAPEDRDHIGAHPLRSASTRAARFDLELRRGLMDPRLPLAST